MTPMTTIWLNAGNNTYCKPTNFGKKSRQQYSISDKSFQSKDSTFRRWLVCLLSMAFKFTRLITTT
jgi:hypothetical protein